MVMQKSHSRRKQTCWETVVVCGKKSAWFGAFGSDTTFLSSLGLSFLIHKVGDEKLS